VSKEITDSYWVPSSNLSVSIEVKKSRFICHLAQASTLKEAKDFIAEISTQFSDATHNCWAFQTEAPGSTRTIGCSDDGEPSGTAGKPMLNILVHADVGELVAVVTRYYGGIKLGTGGLSRAYSESVKAALSELKVCKKVNWLFATLSFDYAEQSQIEKTLKDNAVEIINSQFDDKVTFDIRYGANHLQELNRALSNISQGRLSI